MYRFCCLQDPSVFYRVVAAKPKEFACTVLQANDALPIIRITRFACLTSCGWSERLRGHGPIHTLDKDVTAGKGVADIDLKSNCYQVTPVIP